MALLDELLVGVRILSRVGEANHDIVQLAIDSRKVLPGSLFIARKGVHVDGHGFIDQAIDAGAATVICEMLPDQLKPGAVYVVVKDSTIATGVVARNFYENPSADLQLIGVTGTNGKTTVATVCYQLMQGLGFRCGLLSTVLYKVGNEDLPATHTTPDIIETNAYLRKMVDAGCTHAFMEVSSHALDQNRVWGLQYSGAVFTNITHEHLDYHKTFRAYMDAKKRLFDSLSADAFALINADDRNSNYMIQNTDARIIRYGLRSVGDVKGRIIENSKDGLHLDVEGREVHCFMKGTYNASNLLAAYGVAIEYVNDPLAILEKLSSVQGADGRFDILWGPSHEVMAVVDYAHTPDALDKVLTTIRKFSAGSVKRVMTIIGCGGNRDKEKRPLMAYAIAKQSDIAIFTSDNPRMEDPQDIIRQMNTGLVDDTGNTKPEVAGCEVYEIVDRAQAIKVACRLARSGDVILVAGKGHEKYQEIKGTKVPFDDKAELKAYLP